MADRTASCMPRMTITDLPTDILSSITRHIQQEAWQRDKNLDDIAALRSVCRSLRLAVDLIVTHARLHPNVDSRELRSVTQRFAGLEVVKLQQLHNSTVDPMLDALAVLPHLRSLDVPIFAVMHLWDWTRLSGLTRLVLRHTGAEDRPHSQLLAFVLSRLTALRSLVLAGDPTPELNAIDGKDLTRLSRLTHLDLGVAKHVAALAAQLPNLQSLALHLSKPDPYAPAPTQQEDLSVLNSLTGLTRLCLSANLGDPQLESLRLGADIMTSLRKTPKFDIVAQFLAPLQDSCRLASLHLRAQPPHVYSIDRVRVTGSLPEAALLPRDSLRELRLIDCEVTADAAAKLAVVAGRLRVLHLVRCHGALEQLLQAAMVVEDVSLQGAVCESELLAALHPAAGTLRALDAANVLDDVSKKDAEHMVAKGLTSLTTSGGEVRMEAVGAVAQLAQLRRLRLRYPRTAAEPRLSRLSALTRLTSLQLSGFTMATVTGAWLAALAAARVPLRELRLCGHGVRPGHGAEAAIGRLTCLTSLHMSVQRHRDDPLSTLQLELLGGGGGSGPGSSCSSNGSGRAAARRNMGLQELTLECWGRLSDSELAAAAAALPDLRRLEVVEEPGETWQSLGGLCGTGLAAFGACRRLRDVVLRGCGCLKGEQLAEQLPQVGCLSSLRVEGCPRVDSSAIRRLQAAFRDEHGRHLRVELLREDVYFDEHGDDLF